MLLVVEYPEMKWDAIRATNPDLNDKIRAFLDSLYDLEESKKAEVKQTNG